MVLNIGMVGDGERMPVAELVKPMPGAGKFVSVTAVVRLYFLFLQLWRLRGLASGRLWGTDDLKNKTKRYEIEN
jgi:hypothetical protein